MKTEPRIQRDGLNQRNLTHRREASARNHQVTDFVSTTIKTFELEYNNKPLKHVSLTA